MVGTLRRIGRIGLLGGAAALLAGISIVSAQTTTANIRGRITDTSGYDLPGVSVKVVNLETGIASTSLTDTRGQYRINSLAAGPYEIQAALVGFRTQVDTRITASMGQELELNFTLTVGNVAAELVNTEPLPPMPEAASPTLGGVVGWRELPTIPLNGRNFLELVPLQAGALLADTGAASAAFGFAEKLSMDGARYSSNLFLLDGADINDASGTAGSTAGSAASLEAIREFRVVTDAYDAAIGRHTGGVVSAVTKSGTNELHGSLFEFLRNGDLDARNFFDAVPGSPQPVDAPDFQRDQFGFTLGGPVRPAQTFFFGSYEGLREQLGSTPTYEVPSLNMRAGLLYGTQYAIDPRIAPFLNAFHLPNQPELVESLGSGFGDVPTGIAGYVTSASQQTTEDYWMGRVDYRISARDSLFARLVVENSQLLDPGLYTRQESAAPSRLATAEETRLYSPEFVGRTQFSFHRTDAEAHDIATSNFHFPQLNFTGQPGVPGTFLVPGISGIDASTDNPQINVQNNWQFQEDLSFASGGHTAKWGLLYERLQYNQRADLFSGGEYTFASPESFLLDQPFSALFMMPGTDDIRGWRQNLAGLYFQEDLRLAPSLSLNVGLRYEFITVPTEVNGKVATIRDLTPAHLYTVTPQQTDTGNPLFRNPSLHNFEPRLGLAWSPFRSRKTSVRAGFGIFHDQILPVNYAVPGVRVAPFYSVAEAFAQNFPSGSPLQFPNAYIDQRPQVLANRIRPDVNGIEYNISQPAVMKWSLDIERQLSPNMLLELGYSANRGTHLDRGSLLLNSTPAVEINGQQYLAVDLPVPNPNWNNIQWQTFDGTSFYNAFRVEVQQRLSGGVQFQAAYTFSKATDDTSTLAGGDYNNDPVGYRNQKWRGPSAFNIPHSLYGTLIYELPGSQMQSLLGQALGGWTVSTLLRINSGPPQTLTAARPLSNPSPGVLNGVQFVGASSVDLAPGDSGDAIHPGNPNNYFDLTQFRWPANFLTNPSLAGVPGLGDLIALGNLGRGTVTAPGIASLDMTLMKSIRVRKLGDAGQFQFRVECFNVLNRVNFGFADGNLFDSFGRTDPEAGLIQSTRGPSRQIQLAAKLLF